MGANVIYIHECQINPFYCPTKFAEAYNGDHQPWHAPSPSYPSSTTYVCLSVSLSFFSSLLRFMPYLFVSHRSCSTSISQQSYTDPKSLVDLFAACNWPISLESPLDREELPTVVANLSRQSLYVLNPFIVSKIHTFALRSFK